MAQKKIISLILVFVQKEIMKSVRDIKIISREECLAQHRLLVLNLFLQKNEVRIA